MMRNERKSFRRKMFRSSKVHQKKKSGNEREGRDVQNIHRKETDEQWCWLSEEMGDQVCWRLDRRQRRLNSELLRAVEEESVQKVASCLERGASANATCGPLRNTACHLAAFTGNSDVLSLLLKRGASPRKLDPQGRSPLHLAAWLGKPACVKLLLDCALDTLNTKTGLQEVDEQVHRETLDSWSHDHDSTKNQLPQLESGSTPLHVACQRLHLECIQALLTAGADVALRDNNGMTPIDVTGEKLIGEPSLHVTKIFPDVYKVLMDAGAELSPGSHYMARTTVMHTAVALQSLEAITLIARTPGFSFSLDRNGNTPMHLAVSLRLQAPLRVLIQSATARSGETNTNDGRKLVDPDLASLGMKDIKGNSPLHAAVSSQWRTGVGILLEAGADTCERNSNGATAVHLAAESGNSDILEEILNIHESKSVIGSPDNKEETPLFRAVMSESVECVRLLLDAGACMRHTLKDATTVLHRAATFNSPAVLEELTRRDRSSRTTLINQTESRGMTPLHVACLAGSTTCVKFLLSAGCDISMKTNIESHSECTVLHLASLEGHFKVVEIILEHYRGKELIEARDSHGCTPLHLACQYGRRECIRKLLLSGADLSAKTNKKRTTAISLLFSKVYQPIAFLEEILDSHIKVNNLPLNDPQCVITIDYGLLVPRVKCNKEMKVLDALFDTGTNCNQECLVLHPVVESFLFLKWQSWRRWFYHSFVTYVVFLLCFSVLVISMYHLADNGLYIPHAISDDYIRPTILVTLIWLIAVELESAYRLPKYYFMDLDSWLKWSSYILASVVTMMKGRDDWNRFVATLAILLSWAELMFQVSRNPNWGYYINMFSKVALNVLKVLLTFIFLIIGFALAFMVQFKSQPPFETPWEAFVKTTVMMTSEFEYSSIFINNENVAFPVFGRVLFLIFLVMVGIVLMNLLVGLAVSDINSLETQGKMNRLRKQADFLRVIQPTYLDLWYMPKWMKRRLCRSRKVQQPIQIRPGTPLSSEQLVLPRRIVDAVIARAEAHRKTEEIYTIQNVCKKLNELVTLFSKSPTDVISESHQIYLQQIKGQVDAYKDVYENSKHECEKLTARKLDKIQLQLTAIMTSLKEFKELLPQEISVQVQ